MLCLIESFDRMWYFVRCCIKSNINMCDTYQNFHAKISLSSNRRFFDYKVLKCTIHVNFSITKNSISISLF